MRLKNTELDLSVTAAVQSRLDRLRRASEARQQLDIAVLHVLSVRYIEPGWHVDNRLYAAICRAAREYGCSVDMAKLAAMISGLSLALADAHEPQLDGIRIDRNWVKNARGKIRRDAVPVVDLDWPDLARWIRRRARWHAEVQLLEYNPNDARPGRVRVDPLTSPKAELVEWDDAFRLPGDDVPEAATSESDITWSVDRAVAAWADEVADASGAA